MLGKKFEIKAVKLMMFYCAVYLMKVAVVDWLAV